MVTLRTENVHCSIASVTNAGAHEPSFLLFFEIISFHILLVQNYPSNSQYCRLSAPVTCRLRVICFRLDKTGRFEICEGLYLYQGYLFFYWRYLMFIVSTFYFDKVNETYFFSFVHFIYFKVNVLYKIAVKVVVTPEIIIISPLGSAWPV